MYCNTSVLNQIARGVLAVACIAGAIVLTPHFWPAVALFAVAVVLMRGCPICWLLGLVEAIESSADRKRCRQDGEADRAPE
jgi:hypothetical protein